jgi:large subunit ribosomal protein L25
MATPRQGKKKSENRLLRETKKIPAVVYGRSTPTTAIHVDENEFVQLVRQAGQNAIMNLTWGEDSISVIVGEIQKDKIKNEIVHIDFQEVNMSKKLHVEVPIDWVGESIGVKEGGVLQKQLRAIDVRCLPSDIPDSITVDISALAIGDSLTIGDISLSNGVEVQIPLDTVLISVLPPTLETDSEEPQIDEDREPEIIDPRDGPGIDVAR